MGNISFDVNAADWQQGDTLYHNNLNAQVNTNRNLLNGLFTGLNEFYQNANSGDAHVADGSSVLVVGDIVKAALDGILDTTVSGVDINVNSGKDINIKAKKGLYLGANYNSLTQDYNYILISENGNMQASLFDSHFVCEDDISFESNGGSFNVSTPYGTVFINSDSLILKNGENANQLNPQDSYNYIKLFADENELYYKYFIKLQSVNENGESSFIELTNGEIWLNGEVRLNDVYLDTALANKVDKHYTIPQQGVQDWYWVSDITTTDGGIHLKFSEAYFADPQDYCELIIGNDDIILRRNGYNYSGSDETIHFFDTIYSLVEKECTNGNFTSNITNQGTSVYLKTTNNTTDDYTQIEVLQGDIVFTKNNTSTYLYSEILLELDKISGKQSQLYETFVKIYYYREVQGSTFKYKGYIFLDLLRTDNVEISSVNLFDELMSAFGSKKIPCVSGMIIEYNGNVSAENIVERYQVSSCWVDYDTDEETQLFYFKGFYEASNGQIIETPDIKAGLSFAINGVWTETHRKL